MPTSKKTVAKGGKKVAARSAPKKSALKKKKWENLAQFDIALRDTDLKRTIIIPADTDLYKCASIIMEVFGWHGCHSWEFAQGRNTRYAVPSDLDAELAPMGVKSYDARKCTIGELLKKKGDKIEFDYDSGDGWEHVITRMDEPEFDIPCCCSREGTMGIDDIGGPWGLKQFTEKMLKYETSPASKRDKSFRKELEWYGFGTKEKRIRFLNGPSPMELSLSVYALLQTKLDDLMPLG